nr:hypothetical protein [Tanacetum cinerariifolium]
LLVANIEALKDNPTTSSEFLIKSSSISPKSFLEETNTFDNSLPEFENFCFDLKEISSGSITTHSDISLPNYEAFYFYDDHIEKISSSSTTTHSGISLSEYDSFIFDLSNDQFPPTDRSNFTHEEFANELAHIISPPEYDCFYFRNFPDSGEWISILNFGIRENLSSTTRVNLPVEDDHSLLLACVVWILLAYLTYPVISPYLYSFGNEDTIFDPGIAINRFYSFKPGLSHRCGTFKKFNTHRSHLNESPMEMIARIVTSFVLLVFVFHSQELHILTFILGIQACPHHGFSKLHQLDTFYNALNTTDQDSLNSSAGGNFLDKMPRECLKIIESKSRVRQSRSKAVVAKVSTSSSTPVVSSDVTELKDMVRALLFDKKNQAPAPAIVKAVEQSCVTCGGDHSYQNCPATDANVYHDNIQAYVSQAATDNFNQRNTNARPPVVANQIRPLGFPPV